MNPHPARVTARVVEYRGGPVARRVHRIFDDGSQRIDGGRKKFGKALRQQQRRASR